MGINFEKAMGVHADTLRLRADRTKILASNLANESTPGYQARDIDFGASLRQSADGTGPALLDGGGPDLLYRVPNHPTQDGNTVELGVEQAEFSQNTSDFQASLAFLNMNIKGLAKAIAGQ